MQIRRYYLRWPSIWVIRAIFCLTLPFIAVLIVWPFCAIVSGYAPLFPKVKPETGPAMVVAGIALIIAVPTIWRGLFGPYATLGKKTLSGFKVRGSRRNAAIYSGKLFYEDIGSTSEGSFWGMKFKRYHSRKNPSASINVPYNITKADEFFELVNQRIALDKS